MTVTRSDLVLLSGGLDSATLLAECALGNTAALAVTVDYGQRHRREIGCARRLARHYRVPWMRLDLRRWGRMLARSALTDVTVSVPHGHYEDPVQQVTVVPNRNATFLSAAVAVALSRRVMFVLTAVHAGDYAIYPDCRPDFLDAFARMTDLGTEGLVGVQAPFLHLDKAAIAKRATALGVPVALTYSCYEGKPEHCGRCGACAERREALSDHDDPTIYRA